MSKIVKQDTNGVKALLATGELGYDNYPTGGDAGRVYVGTGSVNIPQAKKAEVVAVDGKVDTHVARVDNPHNVTKVQIGLGDVDNTSDINKPVSTAVQTALDTKQAVLVSGTNIKTIEGQSIVGSGDIDLSKGDVGLSNVDNTADSAKVVASAAKWTTSRLVNGTAVDGTVDITTSQWGTSRDITIGSTLKAVDGSTNVAWTLAEIGAIGADSPAFTGVPTAPTAAVNTSTAQLATTAFVNAEITNDAIPRVVGIDTAIVRFNGTTGDVQNSNVIIDDIGNLTINSGALRGSHGGGNIASNFAAGDLALVSNTTGNYNTASGSSALVSNTTGNYNTASGTGALSSNTDGSNNTANGVNALRSNTTGYSNTANGVNALRSNTTFSNVSGFGYNSQVTASNQVQLGDSATTTYVYGTVQNRSDLRDKADVRDTVLGLDFIKSLRPVDYKWDMREDYKTEMPVAPEIEKPSEDDTEALAEYNRIQDEYKLEVERWLEDNKLENIVKDGSKNRARYHQGFIAQEVQALGVEFGGIQDHSIKGGEDVLSIGYDEMIAPLVKAMQEMSVKMEAMQLKINELEGVE